MNETLKNSQFKTKVKQHIRNSSRSRDENASNENKISQNRQDDMTSVTNVTFIVIRSSFSAEIYILRNAWILDNESNIHVCNDTMLSRYIKHRDLNFENCLIAKTQRLSIESYEFIILIVDTFRDLESMTLMNVTYVADFMTNTITLNLLIATKMHFDLWKMHLHSKDNTLIHVKSQDDHYLLKNNKSLQLQTFFVKKKTDSSQNSSEKVTKIMNWHRIMKHAFNEAIQHLQAAAEKMIMSDVKIMSKTHQCETCSLSKIHKIISRSSDNAEISSISVYRIIYDLMIMSSIYNKNEWIFHFACHAIDFNMIFTHSRKRNATKIIRQTLNIIKTRFNAKMIFMRSDEERTLEVDFQKIIRKTDIIFESFASDFSEQNDHSKRKDEILIMKIKAMRIDVDLFEYLWSEIIKTADYIANSTSMTKHRWKTS